MPKKKIAKCPKCGTEEPYLKFPNSYYIWEELKKAKKLCVICYGCYHPFWWHPRTGEIKPGKS